MTNYVYKFKQGETDLIFSSLNKAKKYVKNVVMPRDTLKEWFVVCMECLGQIEVCRDKTHIVETMKKLWIIMYSYGESGDSDLDVEIQKFKVH